MSDVDLNKLTLRMALPRPLSLQELSAAVEGAKKIAPPSAKVNFILREIGTQRDPETAVAGLVVTWTPDA